MTKKIIGIITILIILVIAAIIPAIFLFTGRQPVHNSASPDVITYRLDIPIGRTIKTVATELKQQHIIRSELVFYLTARQQNIKIQAGVYTVSSDQSVTEILNLLQTGQREYIPVSIPEGLTVSKIATLLEQKNVVQAEEFKKAAQDVSLLTEYQIPAASFEGYLFPDTYYFDTGMTAEAVVRMMVDTFFTRIETIPALHDMSPEDLFYVVRLASIVEREYRVAEEAPLIASVFTNRLKENIGLYSCATIEYIITEIQGLPHPDVILEQDLKINSPYNTYMWAGLPPGPISNPGLIALQAAADPPETEYYFFRLIDPEKGTHYFSAKFEEHINAGRLYTKQAAQ